MNRIQVYGTSINEKTGLFIFLNASGLEILLKLGLVYYSCLILLPTDYRDNNCESFSNIKSRVEDFILKITNEKVNLDNLESSIIYQLAIHAINNGKKDIKAWSYGDTNL